LLPVTPKPCFEDTLHEPRDQDFLHLDDDLISCTAPLTSWYGTKIGHARCWVVTAFAGA
jgi:hypothetical protein